MDRKQQRREFIRDAIQNRLLKGAMSFEDLRRSMSCCLPVVERGELAAEVYELEKMARLTRVDTGDEIILRLRVSE